VSVENGVAISLIQDFTNVTTFKGWNVVPFPLAPGFRSVEFTATDTVAQVGSPFTQQSQFQTWPGGDIWHGTVTLPKMPRSQAAQWIAFLLALRGAANAFMIGDPFAAIPQGSPAGVPVVDSVIATNNVAMATTLVTKGWKPSTFRMLLPGDYIQVGLRMHVVLNTINPDSTGAATIGIWPSLRERPADGSSLILSKPKGLFRLAENKRTWSVDETRLFGLSFKIAEAK
jgi:hypothetical protein